MFLIVILAQLFSDEPLPIAVPKQGCPIGQQKVMQSTHVWKDVGGGRLLRYTVKLATCK